MMEYWKLNYIIDYESGISEKNRGISRIQEQLLCSREWITFVCGIEMIRLSLSPDYD